MTLTECPDGQVHPTDCPTGLTATQCFVDATHCPEGDYPTNCPEDSIPTACRFVDAPTHCEGSIMPTTCASGAVPTECPHDGQVLATVCPGGVGTDCPLYLRADVNRDGCVNVADLLIVRNNLGKSGRKIRPAGADVNFDSVVNIADLLIVRNNLGKGECR
jgi:hypothetical protein